MSENMLDRLHSEYYTTEQVAQAVCRETDYWCRIRNRYVAQYNLVVIRVGRRFYYRKDTVDQMIEDILKNGDESVFKKKQPKN
jgi:hypothetical protein